MTVFAKKTLKLTPNRGAKLTDDGRRSGRGTMN
jgi:hypothetical protein